MVSSECCRIYGLLLEGGRASLERLSDLFDEYVYRSGSCLHELGLLDAAM
jgi:hypothetical protein